MEKETLKVEWRKSHPSFGYFPGNTCDLLKETAEALIKSKHVKLFMEENPGEPTIDLPEDMPARLALIANKVFTLAEAKEIKDFTQIKGIGKSTNTQILEFLNEL